MDTPILFKKSTLEGNFLLNSSGIEAWIITGDLNEASSSEDKFANHLATLSSIINLRKS